MQPSSPAPVLPGCVLFLLQASASMSEPLSALHGEVKLQTARRLIGELLDGLAGLGANLDVGVVAYRGGEGACFVPLLPGSTQDRPLVALARLHDGPGGWLGDVSAEGAPARGAL